MFEILKKEDAEYIVDGLINDENERALQPLVELAHNIKEGLEEAKQEEGDNYKEYIVNALLSDLVELSEKRQAEGYTPLVIERYISDIAEKIMLTLILLDEKDTALMFCGSLGKKYIDEV